MAGIWHQILSVAFLVGVIGNLIASALWALPTITSLRRKMDAQHKEHMTHIMALHKEVRNGPPVGM